MTTEGLLILLGLTAFGGWYFGYTWGYRRACRDIISDDFRLTQHHAVVVALIDDSMVKRPFFLPRPTPVKRPSDALLKLANEGWLSANVACRRRSHKP